MADEDPTAVELPLVWVGNDEVPIHFANQFLFQLQGSEFVLSVGQMTPPAVLGTAEERMSQVQTWPFLPVHTVARFGFTPQRVKELIAVLQQLNDAYEEGVGQ